jgi:hypothetical protein
MWQEEFWCYFLLSMETLYYINYIIVIHYRILNVASIYSKNLITHPKLKKCVYVHACACVYWKLSRQPSHKAYLD